MSENINNRVVSMRDLAPLIMKTAEGGGSIRITATGVSMMPLLLDRISVVCLSGITTPKLGDMVLYRRKNGAYVLHRIVRCHSDGTYTMCGDGQTALEPGIEREQMLAAVTSFVRKKCEINCTNPIYRLWWHLHIASLPLRRFVMRGINYIRRRLKKLK